MDDNPRTPLGQLAERLRAKGTEIKRMDPHEFHQARMRLARMLFILSAALFALGLVFWVLSLITRALGY